MDSVWYVSLPKNNKLYYVADIEDTVILWCLDRTQAISFPTEQTVVKFVERYLKNRTDIKLVIG